MEKTTAQFIDLVQKGHIGYYGLTLVPGDVGQGIQCWPIHEKPAVGAARYQISDLYYYDNEDYYRDYEEDALNDVVLRLENYYYKKGLKKGYQVAARQYKHKKNKRGKRLLRN